MLDAGESVTSVIVACSRPGSDGLQAFAFTELGVVAVIAFFILPRWAAAALIAIELLALNAGFNALVDQKYFCPSLPIVDALRARAPRSSR